MVCFENEIKEWGCRRAVEAWRRKVERGVVVGGIAAASVIRSPVELYSLVPINVTRFGSQKIEIPVKVLK